METLRKSLSGVMAVAIKIGVVPSATPTFIWPWSMVSPLNKRLWLQGTYKWSVTPCMAHHIYTPRDYIVISETARMHPSPYKVTQLYHNDFMKLPGAYVTNIWPGKKVGDPTVHDLRALQYLADGQIQYKLDFESDWEDLLQRISIPKEPSQSRGKFYCSKLAPLWLWSCSCCSLFWSQTFLICFS